MVLKSKIQSEDDFLDDLHPGKSSEISEKFLYITVNRLYGLRKEFEGVPKYITISISDKKSSTDQKEQKNPNWNETIAFTVKRRPHFVSFFLYYIDEKKQTIQLGEGILPIDEELSSEETQKKVIFENNGYIIGTVNVTMMYQKPKKK
eukprot:gene309-6723_t